MTLEEMFELDIKIHDLREPDDLTPKAHRVRFYSADIAAAWPLFEEMARSEETQSLDLEYSPKWQWCVARTANSTVYTTASDTAPHAIALAYLQWRQGVSS